MTKLTPTELLKKVGSKFKYDIYSLYICVCCFSERAVKQYNHKK